MRKKVNTIYKNQKFFLTMIQKENLVDLQEKFEKVKKLIEEDSKFDPETEPYFSKYAARQQLLSMQTLIGVLKEKPAENEEITHKLIGMHGAVQLQLGIIAFDTEELSIAEKHFNEALQLIQNHEELAQVASVALNLYNQLGILWARREQEKGQEFLEKADKFYNKIKDLGIIPIDCNDIFLTNYEINEEDALKKFEKSYTLTLYYLAQVYGPVDSLKSAVYCHRTLQRQLENNDYDRIEWALNTATLSQFLMEKNGFKQARHHLAASLFMLNEHERVLNAIIIHDEVYEAQMETFRHRSADVARCWAKYGLVLLANSKERLLSYQNIEETMSMCTDITEMNLDDSKSNLTRDDLKNLMFSGFDISAYEAQVTDKFVLTVEDAKLVFLNAQKWLNNAHKYYTLNTLASDYIEIALDVSKSYDLLAFFEELPENRTKLYKRAADVLEKILADVNRTYYLEYCRNIWFRLGIFYSDILDIKLDKIKESDERPNHHAVKKVNSLIDKSTFNFRTFIESYQKPDGEFPVKVVEGSEKAYLQSIFHIAALTTRHITLDKSTQLKNTQKSLDAYKMLVNYCKVNEKAEELVKSEIGVAKEMVTLLPLKIARLTNELPPVAS